MMNENFTPEEKLKVDLETENQLNTFIKKLHSESKEENTLEFEKISCESEDDVSEVSELEDVDCSAFVGTGSVGESNEVGNLFNNNVILDVKHENVCNKDNVVKTAMACEPVE